jgi:predicted dinucleotide-binding enzyme
MTATRTPSTVWVTEPGPAAEEAASPAPRGAEPVKAFNTTFAGALVDVKIGEQPLDVFAS